MVSLCLVACSACDAPASETGNQPRQYGLHYEVLLHPDTGIANIEMRVRQPQRWLRELQFDIDESFRDINGDGELRIADNRVIWQLPEHDGTLRWQVELLHRRSESGYDALLNEDFGIFRAEDVVPRAQSTAIRGVLSDTTMSFQLPSGWSIVTEYDDTTQPISVSRPERRLSQPTGWIAAGTLGVRRETIAGTRVTVAGPKGHAIRRLDMLALLNWTLPELNKLLDETPERLTIVSAGNPMWRGGLSAPDSLFLHADRPLISENATSTLLHEVMHVALGIRATDGFDWIVEGIAEFYSLELLHRGGAITSRRYHRALETQREWARDAESLCGRSSSGATTALAVTKFKTLDTEIRRATKGMSSLDNLVADLQNIGMPIDIRQLQFLAAKLMGTESATLKVENLPGCHSIAN